ncbi:hypothetical protein SDC9_212705 [bioreactor metagenome]|uniref:Uncharacterized protein n=1 Tax=bioreactor metagenome TaxID=1076179 RepID=A0A645JNH3_9ZZZZ
MHDKCHFVFKGGVRDVILYPVHEKTNILKSAHIGFVRLAQHRTSSIDAYYNHGLLPGQIPAKRVSAAHDLRILTEAFVKNILYELSISPSYEFPSFVF